MKGYRGRRDGGIDYYHCEWACSGGGRRPVAGRPRGGSGVPPGSSSASAGSSSGPIAEPLDQWPITSSHSTRGPASNQLKRFYSIKFHLLRSGRTVGQWLGWPTNKGNNKQADPISWRRHSRSRPPSR